MSQSGTRGDEVETCQMALEAALEKGVSFCETRESRMQVLAQIVGLDADDVDPDEALEAGPDPENIQQTREWVLARAEEKIGNGADSPLDAINGAWAEAGDYDHGEEEAEQGPDHGPEGDEEEAEDDEEDESPPLAEESPDESED